MEKERNPGIKCFILKRMLSYVSSQEKSEACFLDYMREHTELTPEPPSPPPDEFQKIMAEINRRGVETVISRQLKVLYYVQKFRKSIQKPMLILMAALILLASVMGGSAKNAHNYRMRERYGGRSIKVGMVSKTYVSADALAASGIICADLPPIPFL